MRILSTLTGAPLGGGPAGAGGGAGATISGCSGGKTRCVGGVSGARTPGGIRGGDGGGACARASFAHKPASTDATSHAAASDDPRISERRGSYGTLSSPVCPPFGRLFLPARVPLQACPSGLTRRYRAARTEFYFTRWG